MSNKKVIWTYIILVLSLSFLVGGVVSYFYEKESTTWQFFPTLYTFFPALVALLLMRNLKIPVTLKNLGLVFTGNRTNYLLAFFIPIILTGINIMVQIKVGNYILKPELNYTELGLVLIANQFVLLIFILGEEIGWRSFLQNRLVEEYGIWMAIAILGVVWGLWHAPIALKGYNLPEYPQFEAFVFYPFICICYASIMMLLFIKTKSVIPSLIFHTTNNNIGGIVLVMFNKQNPFSEMLVYFVIGSLMLLSTLLLIAREKRITSRSLS